jgi:hypothetical protein
MEATRSSETSVHFQRTTRRYIPDDRTLQQLMLLLFAVRIMRALGKMEFLMLKVTVHIVACNPLLSNDREIINYTTAAAK